MGSLGLITARISKTRVPIKTDRTQYGGLGAATESGNAPNMKINRPLTPTPISLVLPPHKRGGRTREMGVGVVQPLIREEPGINTRALRGASRWKRVGEG